MPLQPAICQAISQRHIIRFRYQGGVRVVEPYIHGRSTAGNEVLRGFQLGGASRSREPVGWKLFDVAKIAAVELTQLRFPNDRAGYHAKDPVMRHVHCQVPPASAPLSPGPRPHQ